MSGMSCKRACDEATRTAPSRWVQPLPQPRRASGRLPLGPDFSPALLSPQMQVLLAQVQNSEQLLRTLQGTVSQAQERVQLQMVRAWGLGQEGKACDGNWLAAGTRVSLRHLSRPQLLGLHLELVSDG